MECYKLRGFLPLLKYYLYQLLEYFVIFNLHFQSERTPCTDVEVPKIEVTSLKYSGSRDAHVVGRQQ